MPEPADKIGGNELSRNDRIALAHENLDAIRKDSELWNKDALAPKRIKASLKTLKSLLGKDPSSVNLSSLTEEELRRIAIPDDVFPGAEKRRAEIWQWMNDGDASSEFPASSADGK